MKDGCGAAILPLWALVLMAGSASVSAQEWTRFRGPNGTGISDAATVPVAWSEGDVRWKAALPGRGHSSPVVWGERIFVLSAEDSSGERHLLCLDDADGRIRWRRTFPGPTYRIHQFNSFASSTPAVDRDHVYIALAAPEKLELRALTHDGEPVWERDLGPFESQHGGASSPIVYEGLVVLAKDHKAESFVIAVERATGKTRWQSPRPSGSAAYATPCVLERAGRPPELVFGSQSGGFAAFDAATGRPCWSLPDAFDKRVISSPVFASGVIVLTCGSGGGGHYLVAARPPAGADDEPAPAYTIRRSAPYVPTPLAIRDLLFLWSDDGVVSCIRAATGEEVWRERVGGRFFSSPVCVAGRLYSVSTEGEVVVIEASEAFRVLARNALDEPSHATPAVANGRMYVRTLSHLFAIGGRSAAATP